MNLMIVYLDDDDVDSFFFLFRCEWDDDEREDDEDDVVQNIPTESNQVSSFICMNHLYQNFGIGFLKDQSNDTDTNPPPVTSTIAAITDEQLSTAKESQRSKRRSGKIKTYFKILKKNKYFSFSISFFFFEFIIW